LQVLRIKRTHGRLRNALNGCGDDMKAIGFDLGNTLISYENFPLNWQSFYADALRKVLEVIDNNNL
jgi:hypothetical protein